MCNLVFPSAGFPGRHCVGAEAAVNFSRFPALASLTKPCLPGSELAHQLGGRGAARSSQPPLLPPGSGGRGVNPRPRPTIAETRGGTLWGSPGHMEQRKRENAHSVSVPTCQRLYTQPGVHLLTIVWALCLWGDFRDLRGVEGGSAGTPEDGAARGHARALSLESCCLDSTPASLLLGPRDLGHFPCLLPHP